jgi:hypothetical protein
MSEAAAHQPVLALRDVLTGVGLCLPKNPNK